MTPSSAAQSIKQVLERQIKSTLKELLESKHLYQSAEVNAWKDAGAIVRKVQPALDQGRDLHGELEFHASELLLRRWYVFDPRGQYTMSEKHCTLFAPDIKTFCKECDQVQPFNVMAASDCLAPASSPRAGPAIDFTSPNGVVQNFVLSVLCQGCKLIPEVFMVRRVGRKLTICGRSPLEHVDVPKVIPSTARRYYSDAIVAHQSGQTLAGLFLLRTFIEQWIRSLGATLYADAALDWYMSTLPADFKARFPSLRDIYGELSSAIHAADESAALFDSARSRIETHFEARKLFKLDDPRFSAPETGGSE